jgi:hypothetical protein
MPLRDLVIGLEAHNEEPPWGLGSLVSPALATVAQPSAARMNLVQAMNALQRGEIARPTDDGDLAGMVVDAELLPLKPAPTPKPQSTAAFDRKGMAERLATRRRALEATFMPDQRKWARLAGYEEYLMENSNG